MSKKNTKFSQFVNRSWQVINGRRVMIKSLAAESMDRVSNMFTKCKNPHDCHCEGCLPIHMKMNELTAQTGLDIMSEYCFQHGANKLGAGIQQSIWGATNAI